MRAKDLRLPVLRMMLAVSAALPVLPPAALFAQSPPATTVSATPGLEGRIVDDVQIRGNRQVPTSVIRNVIRIQAGQKYDPATVQDDYRRIFELKKFSNVEAQVEPTPSGGVVVVFVVTEQELIKTITWRGNKQVDTKTLQDAADIRVGQAIDAFRISLAKQAIANAYRDKNFPMAHVEVAMDPLTQRGELIFDIVEGPQVTIRNIRFLGAVSVAADELKKQVKSATWFPIFSAGKYDPEQVEQDMGAIRQYYHDHGYFDAKVGRKLIFSPDQSELQIDFVIYEGPRYVVDAVTFAGNSKLSDAQLRQGLNLTEGRYYDAEMVQRDVKQIVKDYSPFGFIYAQPNQPGLTDPNYLRVTPQTITRLQPGRVKLQYNIREGKPFRLGRIIVHGNWKSQDKLVLREFRNFAPGSVYDSGGVQDALDRVRALPYFSNVTMTPIGDDPQYRDLLVDVTEQRTAQFSIGAALSSGGGLMGNIVYQQSNFDISNVPADWRDVLSDKSFTGAGQGLRLSFSP
ncbi:MAG TPA: POTRA domain-containing protein, partial [Tepidisphaeraceae bacterium]|nr:POTRA domain-containing protein [Tepidisphaeraceae bacterium]